MTEATLPVTAVSDGETTVAEGSVVWMNHPDTDGHARTSRSAFDSVWRAKGWVESDPEAVRQTELAGEFVREAGADQGATALGTEAPAVPATAPVTSTTAPAGRHHSTTARTGEPSGDGEQANG